MKFFALAAIAFVSAQDEAAADEAAVCDAETSCNVTDTEGVVTCTLLTDVEASAETDAPIVCDAGVLLLTPVDPYFLDLDLAHFVLRCIWISCGTSHMHGSGRSLFVDLLTWHIHAPESFCLPCLVKWHSLDTSCHGHLL